MDAPTGSLPAMNDHQKKVYETLKSMNATSPEKGKTADDIMKAGKFAKGQMLAWIQDLERLGLVKRMARAKAAVYFIVK